MATPGHRGFYTSWQSASQQVAIVAAAALGYAVNGWMTADEINTWGWRIPFFVGCIIVPFIFLLRRSLLETEEFLARKHHPDAREILQSMIANWAVVLESMLLVAFTTTTFYLITVYTPTFGRTVLKLSAADSLIVTLCVGLTNFCWLPIGGALSDRIGRRPLLIAITGLAILTSYPLLAWLAGAPSFERLLLVLLLFSFYFGMYNGAMVVTLAEVMPVQVRVVGFSLAFSLATAIFGGMTPVMSTYLIEITGDKAAPGYWMSLAAACSLVATWLLLRRSRRERAT
jgi:MHS family citrate/tricarballylate:H+ symporter-like MFS transporter